MLQSSQMYHIKKAKRRKVDIILSQITRDYDVDMRHLRSIINYQMNKALRSKFQVSHQRDIDDALYEQCLHFISRYEFQYMENRYGDVKATSEKSFAMRSITNARSSSLTKR